MVLTLNAKSRIAIQEFIVRSMFMFPTRLRLHGPRILRAVTAALTVIAAVLVAVHHWFSGAMAWLPVEIQVAIAIGVFGFLADRTLAVFGRMEPPIKSYPSRQLANEHLVEFVKTYGASKIDLLQFSGSTALSFLKAVAAMGKPVKVRLFVVDDNQALKFNRGTANYHVERIKFALEELRIASKDFPTFQIKFFRYSTNAEVSAILVDDIVASLGWNRSYLDGNPPLLHMQGHNTAAVNAVNDRPLLNFAREQIRKIERFAVPTD